MIPSVPAARPSRAPAPKGAPIALRGVEKVFLKPGEPHPKGTVPRGSAGVTGVDLDIRAGEFICLLGPSGCGKSTLLNLIAGLDKVSGGEILVGGRAIAGPGPDRTVMFQDSALFPWLTLRENIAFPLELAGVPKAEIAERVERVLRLVHLHKFKDNRIHTLSGGMRQRGALARALVCEPGTLLMDEPFAALDAQTREALYEEIERVWLETQKTVVFVTHNVREAVRLGDRIVLMATRPGRIKSIIDVDLPRPRDLDDDRVAAIAARVMDELREEVDRVQKEEKDDAWEMGAGGGPLSAVPGLGAGGLRRRPRRLP